MAERIILDTDIGTYYDDAFAVLFATKCPEIKLEGVTTVYGDTDLRSKIAAKLLKVAGKPNVPVCKGVGVPLKGNALMFGFEGENILEEDERESIKYSDQPADDFIIEKIMQNPGEISVVTLGAVSNVAVAMVKEPRIIENIKQLVMMAAVVIPVLDPKSVMRSPREEYNFNNDPVAAEIVMNSGIPKERLVLVPCDVTLRTPLLDQDWERIKKSNDPVAKQVKSIIDVWPPQEFQIYISVGIPTEFTQVWLHDPLALTCAFDKRFVKFYPMHIATEYSVTPIPRDMVIATDILRTVPKKKEPNMMVGLQVDAERFSNYFTDKIIS
ncbi:nucleoside hydrolase [Atribacter laminatus]|uniref:Pyrimidine-specific ribonucleoside hydrolase RihB n=1 Tax=Atribacter laminatus TaxID=2847778 RepID=A0A7T1AL11_ATRLM|nr:nucleoside hydrolase [Atribacter laminatus]QPM67872.1 Pyrimidine-specific ribonucleoside hydrolase RihB [Atribacter laminatus]